VLQNLVNLLREFWSGLIVGQIEQLGNWNYLLLAIMTLIEGPIATLLGAMAASSGLLNPGMVFIAAAVGNLTADTMWYSVGYLGKTEWLLRHGRRLGITEDHILGLEQAMQKHAPKILLIAKVTLSFAIPTLIAAGLARVRWQRWFPAIVAGEFLWTGTLVYIGYHISLSLRRMEVGLQIVAIVGMIIFIGVIIRYIARYGSRLRLPFG
jgi:membrane protein DedA with SNARE-associated domain